MADDIAHELRQVRHVERGDGETMAIHPTERELQAAAEIERLQALLAQERSYVQFVQRALAFWHPGVGGRADGEFLIRAGDDAMLLFGYRGPTEPSAIERGWIAVQPVTPAPAVLVPAAPRERSVEDIEHDIRYATLCRRCYACGVTLASHPNDGCTPGDCSYRPSPRNPDYSGWRKRMDEVARVRARQPAGTGVQP